MFGRVIVLVLVFTAVAAGAAQAQARDPERDILVTFELPAGKAAATHAPYRARKRYAISPQVRRLAESIANEHGLERVDEWPIASLSVYCLVYRVAADNDRSEILDALRADARVESAQALNAFETNVAADTGYDDTYAELQHGLSSLGLTAAHRYSRGQGIRIAVVDSNVDTGHEDLKGRVRRIEDFAGDMAGVDREHGTAVASIIAARANNALGMVGVAPEARLELYVACWSQQDLETAVCDSFTLAQALDSLLERPPDVLNLSLAGPDDGLLRRLLLEAQRRGIVVVAAKPRPDAGLRPFPANMEKVIAVGRSRGGPPASGDSILAPGDQILVALPNNSYDFRSGSSLAAAHVSGVVALLLAIAPDTDANAVASMLRQSQSGTDGGHVSVNACAALRIADPSLDCGS